MKHKRQLASMVIRGAGLAAMLVAAAGTAAAEQSGTWNARAVLVVLETKSMAVGDQPDHTVSITRFDGAAFNADGKPFLDKARYEVVDHSDTAGRNGGYKTFTEADGSKVFAKYTLTGGTMPDLRGTWEFIGGTGRYQGISGRGEYHVVFVSETALWDELTGEYKVP
jgi:hypothetical protein